MKILSIAALFLSANVLQAAEVFVPGDFILGGHSDGTNFEIGDAGVVADANVWPSAEGPEHLIDGVGQKYLNFAKLNSGAIITASSAAAATSAQFWTANDAESRDPASFALYATNQSVAGNPGDLISLAIFDLVASGGLSLPSGRNSGGSSALVDANSVTLSFANTTAYSTYLILFPTVKDANLSNSMQLAEFQLFSDDEVAPVPLPASLPLLAAGAVLLGFLRRRA